MTRIGIFLFCITLISCQKTTTDSGMENIGLLAVAGAAASGRSTAGTPAAPTYPVSYSISSVSSSSVGRYQSMSVSASTYPITGAPRQADIYLSLNTTIDGPDIAVGSTTINAGQTSVTFTVPAAAVVASQYYVAVCPQGSTCYSSYFTFNKVTIAADPAFTCTGNCNVLVQWTANKEKALNQAGGGYRVCYSQTQGFTSGGTCQDVPYVSGPTAPTSVSIHPGTGRWYIKVYGYSNLNPTGSAASTEFTALVLP